MPPWGVNGIETVLEPLSLRNQPRKGEDMKITTDYLVIGTGIAGLSFALQAAKSGRVAIVTKKGRTEASTNYAQGGIASVLDPDDHGLVFTR